MNYNINKSKIHKNVSGIVKVTISNIIKLISGVLVGFLLPKIIGVTDYGYYKIFTLYATYVGLFAIGLTDGIYLKYGGKDYSELNKEEFRAITRFYILLETLFAILVGFASCFFVESEYQFIIFALAIFLISSNIIGYFQIISQITGRFQELSTRNVVQSFLVILSMVSLWIIHHYWQSSISYKSYTLIFVFINIVLALWYLYTYREITFGKAKQWSDIHFNIKRLIFLGIPLLIANLCSSLILNIDRQFVSIFFRTEEYAVYAFAYNMLSLITTATSAVSVVLYPILKKSSHTELMNNYHRFVAVVLGFVFLCLVVYFPLCFFVPWFLPKYADSLYIFRIILPGLAIQSGINIVIHNYYKTEGLEKNFFIQTIIVLILSVVANSIAYVLFKSTLAISIASIVIFCFWFFISERVLVKKHKVKWLKNTIFMALMTMGFYLITIIDNWWLSLIIYLFFFGLVALLLYKRELHAFYVILKNRNQPNKIC